MKFSLRGKARKKFFFFFSLHLRKEGEGVKGGRWRSPKKDSGKICKKDSFTMETMEIYDYNVLVISFRTLQSQHI